MKSIFPCFAVVLLVASTLQAQEPQTSNTGTNPDAIDTRPDDQRPKLGGVYSPTENGLKVDSVYTNGPLHQHEVFSGDVITHIDGVAMESVEDLETFLLNKNPGDEVLVKRVRDGVNREVLVRLISKTELSEVSNTENRQAQNTSRQYVGVSENWSDRDRLILIDDRLHKLETEVRTLRLQIRQLKNDR